MDDSRFFTRLANLAAAQNQPIRPEALPDVAAHVRKSLDDDASGIAVRSCLRELAQTRPAYFGAEDEAA